MFNDIVKQLAQFSKFRMLLALKSNFNGCQFFREISKFGYFKKLKKCQNKVGKNLFDNFIQHLQSKVNLIKLFHRLCPVFDRFCLNKTIWLVFSKVWLEYGWIDGWIDEWMLKQF